MQPFDDSTAVIDAPKTARMEQRTKAHVKADIQHAAALLGVDETTFVTSVAYERARQTIKDHQVTVLDAGDRSAFFAALDAPAAPTQPLKDALKRHKGMVGDGSV